MTLFILSRGVTGNGGQKLDAGNFSDLILTINGDYACDTLIEMELSGAYTAGLT
ncbi:hypothetical protein [Terribacillus sp. 7520-G]|uniref:hypothetical protein n=1 Tax=Terribacillus sp. 7520-G TaxID=2025389 RepID=UPI0013044BE6|nr:hypothetical protein [Terribacillus sp. 7520-G]